MNKVDPAVYGIDHEEQNEKPTRHYDLTAGMLLASIGPERFNPSDGKGGVSQKAKQTTKKKSPPVGAAEIAELVTDSSQDEHLSWNLFEIHGTRVIQLVISHDEFSEISRALSVFWKCLFISLSDRTVNEIAVCDCQTGFNFYVKSTPQIRERRFEVTIERMATDFNDPEMMETYWRAAEISLHKSKVLHTYRDLLGSDFQLVGTARAKRKFRREFKPRTR